MVVDRWVVVVLLMVDRGGAVEVDWWVVVLLMVGLSFCAGVLGLHGSDEGDV